MGAGKGKTRRAKTNAPQPKQALPGKREPLEERKNLTSALAVLPEACSRFVAENEDAFLLAPGSGSAHQFWLGGYADHVDELCAISHTIYSALSKLRELPFSLEDALLVLFLHDVEKIWKRLPEDTPCNPKYKAMVSDPKALQQEIIKDYGLKLSAEQENALKYVHGELDDYRKGERVMGPLAVFVHDCDYWSARGWHDQPLESGRLPDIFSDTVYL